MFDKDWILEVDASDLALGVVLGQEQVDKEIHLVYFWSRQLSQAECNYSVTDRECLAVVAAFKKFRPYILGRRTVVIGDHTAMKWLFNKVDLSGRHARWQFTLSEFDYEIRTCPGLKNGNADAMSRLPVQTALPNDVEDFPDYFGLLATVFIGKWFKEPWYKEVYMFLETLTI